MVAPAKKLGGARHAAPLFFALLLCLCLKDETASALPVEHRVLVIINDDSPASKQIGAYYVSKRRVAPGNICRIHCPVTEEIDEDKFSLDILLPVADALARPALQNQIEYLVLTKGVPLRIHSETPSVNPQFTPNGDSVDGRLMCQDISDLQSPSRNPFFNSEKRFSHKTTGLYLATRLDGYTVADAEKLVDRSLAARPAKGVFLLDAAPNRDGGGDPPELGLPPLNKALSLAAQSLTARGFTVKLDQTPQFVGHVSDVMGLWNWGSNDASFETSLYLSNSFRPGAIAETAVSTSARTMLPTVGGQSLIADLVANGVTGVKGYVAEPYVVAMARADILFDRYTRGWTLAESFYAASPLLHWKDIVLGDPLCAPYAPPATSK